MHPILFEVAGFPVYTYGLLLAAAYDKSVVMLFVLGRRSGPEPVGQAAVRTA